MVNSNKINVKPIELVAKMVNINKKNVVEVIIFLTIIDYFYNYLKLFLIIRSIRCYQGM